MISETILTDIKKTGFKLTTPRKEVLNVLTTSPLSVQELSETLKEKGLQIDLVTIYRTLELFTSLGIVEKIQFEDKTARFELKDEADHHHHLVCIKCGLVEDCVINEDSLVMAIEQKTKFQVQRHALEFFGFCRRCNS